MQGVLKAKQVEHMPAVFSNDLAKLLQDIVANSQIYVTTKLALQFTALTACRSGEVGGARWSEVNLVEKNYIFQLSA